ncbi:MAG: hypothetical protein ABJA94_01285 [Rhodoglobus sp.]
MIGLTGCTPAQEQETSMQYTEARAELTDLLTAIAATVPGEWEKVDAGARPCSIGGSTGVQFPMLRRGPGVIDGQQEATAEAIGQLLTDAGFAPVIRDRTPTGSAVVVELNYPGEGGDDTGFFVKVMVGTARVTAQGQSRCAEGDANRINHDRQESEND